MGHSQTTDGATVRPQRGSGGPQRCHSQIRHGHSKTTQWHSQTIEGQSQTRKWYQSQSDNQELSQTTKGPSQTTHGQSQTRKGQSQTGKGAQSDHVGAHIDNEYPGLGRRFHAHHAMLLPIWLPCASSVRMPWGSYPHAGAFMPVTHFECESWRRCLFCPSQVLQSGTFTTKQ